MNLPYHLARIIVLLIALILHEVAHAVVALWNGDPTAKNLGRISINPMRHFDYLGLLMILTLPVGYGKPVPINVYNFKRKRLGYFTVAIAGVTVNFLLSFILMGIYVPLMVYTRILSLGNFISSFLFYFFYLGIFINIYLMIFNLLPIYPLDGFRVVESITKERNPYTVFMRKYGQYILLGLIIISLMGEYIYPDLVISYPFLDPLSYVLNVVSRWIVNPILKLWQIIWGVA